MRFDIDVRELPGGRYHEKVLNVQVAFEGITAPEPIEVRVEHSMRKEQRLQGGKVFTDYSEPDRVYVAAITGAITAAPYLNASDVPKNEGSSSLWGKGLGGEYFVKVIPEKNGDVISMLTGVTGVTLVISYSFKELS